MCTHRGQVQALQQKSEVLHRETVGKARQQLADKHALAQQQAAAQSQGMHCRQHAAFSQIIICLTAKVQGRQVKALQDALQEARRRADNERRQRVFWYRSAQAAEAATEEVPRQNHASIGGIALWPLRRQRGRMKRRCSAWRSCSCGAKAFNCSSAHSRQTQGSTSPWAACCCQQLPAHPLQGSSWLIDGVLCTYRQKAQGTSPGSPQAQRAPQDACRTPAGRPARQPHSIQ